MRDRLARLYGGIDPAWATRARSDFSTAVLTPESPLDTSVAEDTEDDDSWEPELPAWANLAVANATATMERRRTTAPSRPAAAPAPIVAPRPEAVAQPERNTLDRRKSDRGPPPGVADRRQSRSFGRRPTH
jgi:hypothetical protein